MSYDLYFCSRQPGRVDFEKVVEWASRLPHFERSSELLRYANPDTGVYFTFEFGTLDDDDSPIPPEVCDSGVSFNLNYNRPSFFAYEAMPFVQDLADCFKFEVFDPQNEGVRPANTEELIKSWLRQNENAIKSLMEVTDFSPPPRMPLSMSMYLWRYSNQRHQLEIRDGTLFVPKVGVFQKKGSGTAEPAVACTQDVPMILPEAHWIVLVGRNGRFTRNKQEVLGVLSRQSFHAAFGSHLRPYETDLPMWLIDERAAREIGEQFRRLDLSKRDDFESLAKDQFIDIELTDRSKH